MFLFCTLIRCRKISYQDIVHACTHILIHKTAIRPYTVDIFAELIASASLTENNITISASLILSQLNMFILFHDRCLVYMLCKHINMKY